MSTSSTEHEKYVDDSLFPHKWIVWFSQLMERMDTGAERNSLNAGKSRDAAGECQSLHRSSFCHRTGLDQHKHSNSLSHTHTSLLLQTASPAVDIGPVKNVLLQVRCFS
jgi:hypothetical protein